MAPTKQSSFLFSLLASLLLLLLSSCKETVEPHVCSDSIGCVTISPGEPIKIGVMQALSGEVALLGEAQIRGLQLSLDKRHNSILGHPVVLQIEDTGCTAEGGANSALKLIADPQTIAIYGSTCSGAASTASQAMSSAGLTMISGNNSAPFLTAIGGEAAPNWQPGYFRTAPNEENAGKAAAIYVFKQLGLRRAATIHDNDIYTQGLASSFKQAFTELGGEIVLDTAINKGETEMAPVLTAVVNSRADLLFFPLFQAEGSQLLLQARKLQELDETLLISGGALIQKSFLSKTGVAAKGMYFVGPSSPQSQLAAELAEGYQNKFKEQPTVNYYLSGYDAAELLFDSIEKATTVDVDGALHLGRHGLRETLYRVTAYEGTTGTLSCDQFGDCALPAFDILRLDDPQKGLKGLQANVQYSYVLTK